MKYHVNAATGEPGPCMAIKRACPHGGPQEHYSTVEEARSAYEAINSSFAPPQRKVKESAGVLLYRDIMDARALSARLHAEKREAGPAAPQDLLDSCTEARKRVRELESRLAALPWDSEDGPAYDDAPMAFIASPKSKARLRKGYENDLDKLGPRELAAYEVLDQACETWLSRLSTAEVKALHSYVQDAQSYAESMAASHGAAATFTNSFKYLHTALEKAPRSEKPVIVYAGVSRERVNEVRDAAHNGAFSMNRVQSTSLNPAMVNSFMRPSEYDGEDHTALEVKTDRIASLSLFHLREEMEILLPPQDYRVKSVESGISYAYSDGYTYEPADRVYCLEIA